MKYFEHQISKDVKELAKVIKKRASKRFISSFLNPEEYWDRSRKDRFSKNRRVSLWKNNELVLLENQQTAMRILDQVYCFKNIRKLCLQKIHR